MHDFAPVEIPNAEPKHYYRVCKACGREEEIIDMIPGNGSCDDQSNNPKNPFRAVITRVPTPASDEEKHDWKEMERPEDPQTHAFECKRCREYRHIVVWAIGRHDCKGRAPLTGKVCPSCKRELPSTAFGKHSARPDGLQAYCKECAKARAAAKA